jgi:uncharacterized protein GlcG (DUF336 family)
MRTTASVTITVDRDGNLVAHVRSDDDLTRRTVKLALEEFWRTDQKSYASANMRKWARASADSATEPATRGRR